MNPGAPEHDTDWLAPAPLWGFKGASGFEEFDLLAPAVVRVDGDDFMDAFGRMLNPDPKSGVTAGAALWAARAGVKGGDKLADVLYQPLHGCYALVCASLTCRLAGRPEKAVAPAAGDDIGFVLRRYEADGAEFAWVPAGSGVGSWVPAPTAAPVPGEELIPLFPVPVNGLIPRRLWAGLVPTASRETYQLRGPKPKPEDPLPDVAADDPRLEELDSGPGTALRTVPAVVIQNDGKDARRQESARAQGLQALLGLAAFIVDRVGVAVPAGGTLTAALAANPRTAPLATALAPLANWLNTAWSSQPDLLGGAPADQPTFDPAAVGLPLGNPAWEGIRVAVKNALPRLPVDPTGPPRGGPRPKFEPDFDPNDRQKYVVRCVYYRPRCPRVV
ncbi:MAG: hypothetical protein K2V38_09775, partial [Gemmataceae bacterium]|nr:hypothetical protein [Gemmataceae bacterium]